MAFRKKLIEVSLPLDAINRESAREKSIRHGHPSTLHLWWARRPLAACRAVLFSQLVDDPSSVTDEFPTHETQKAERERLHRLIERLVPWEASANETILNEARYEIARSVARSRGEKLPSLKDMKPKELLTYLQEKAPPVYDPFSGGGSIPLEAQRLGLRAMGSDLNPVAVLIGKALVELPPKFADQPSINPKSDRLRHFKGAEGLAEDVRYYGRLVGEEARRRIGHLYPELSLPDGRQAPVIAWLWARTVPSPDPQAGGVHVPLVSSFVLSSRPGKEAILVPAIDRTTGTYRFLVRDKPSAADLEVAKLGTKGSNGFRCILTGAPIPFEYIRNFGKSTKFGNRLLAIVADSDRGRLFSEATEVMESFALGLAPNWRPEAAMNPDALGFRVPEYGLTRWSDLFTNRQTIALTAFSEIIGQAREIVRADAIACVQSATHANEDLATEYANAVTTYLTFALSRMADLLNNLCQWRSDPAKLHVGHLFSRQAISMVWDYAEASPFSTSAGSWEKCLSFVPKVIEQLVPISPGRIKSQDATKNSFSDVPITFSTDPPYYDNVGYADLSDFFYVWLRPILANCYPDLFRRLVSPKDEELVATPYRHGGKKKAEEFFLSGMKEAISAMSNAMAGTPLTLYYAFKQQEALKDGITSAGWATFLQAIVDCGLTIDGTWPMRSELSNRTRGQKSNALATSIVLVCRKPAVQAESIVRSDFLRALRREMPDALHEIRTAGVGPTDIQQAAIGPGIGIFTRYSQVLNPDGTAMLVKDALKLINQVREEIASDLDADYDAETRFALDWFTAHGFGQGKASDAITMTNAVNISLDGVKRAGFFFADSGIARLLRRDELPNYYSPTDDNTPTVWEACQHLIKSLEAERGGIDAAAALYTKLASHAEPAQTLARRLYDICEQRGWASEGYAYNRLFQDWEAIRARSEELGTKSSDLFGVSR